MVADSCDERQHRKEWLLLLLLLRATYRVHDGSEANGAGDELRAEAHQSLLLGTLLHDARKQRLGEWQHECLERIAPPTAAHHLFDADNHVLLDRLHRTRPPSPMPRVNTMQLVACPLLSQHVTYRRVGRGLEAGSEIRHDLGHVLAQELVAQLDLGDRRSGSRCAGNGVAAERQRLDELAQDHRIGEQSRKATCHNGTRGRETLESAAALHEAREAELTTDVRRVKVVCHLQKVAT